MIFDEATRVHRLDAGAWSAEIRPGWDIFDNANGGYMMSIAARAMSELCGGRDPVSVTAHFTRPGKPGPVRIAAETVRDGRTYSTARAEMVADDGVILATLGTFAEAGRPRSSLELIDSEIPDVPPPDDCVPALPSADAPLPPPFLANVEERIHPDDARALEGIKTGKARVRGWFRLRGGEPMSPLALLVAADAFPPAVFNADLPLAWTPTLELTTHVRGVEITGWVRCQFTTRFVTGGYLEEDGELWDEEGRLVAQSRQLALVPR